MTDSRRLRDRAWAYLAEFFRDLDDEPKLMIPLILSGIIMFFASLKLFAEKIPLMEYITTCASFGAAVGWILGCVMVVVFFCVQIESGDEIDGKLNFGCGIITAVVSFLWFMTITIVFLAPVAWFIRMF